MVFIAKIRYTWFILLCKKIALNPFAVRILMTPKCHIHNNIGQANNLFLQKYFRKKVISEVKIVVIFEGGQSKVKRAVLCAAETWRDDCQSTLENLWTKFHDAPTEMKLVGRAFAGCYHLIFLIIEFLYFFFFGCPPSKVKVKYLYSATRCDAFASYVVCNIYIF